MKVGITSDDYKLIMFKECLDEAGFEYQMKPFIIGSSLILVETADDKVVELGKLCERVEKHFRDLKASGMN